MKWNIFYCYVIERLPKSHVWIEPICICIIFLPTLGIELSCNAEGRINTPIALLAQAKLLTIGKLWLPFVSSSFFCQKYHFLTKIKLTMKPTMLNGKINNKFSLKKNLCLHLKFLFLSWPFEQEQDILTPQLCHLTVAKSESTPPTDWDCPGCF